MPMTEFTLEEVANRFEEMAAAIRLNKDVQRFGGAYVIVAPTGEATDMLMLNSMRDAPQFWSTLKTTAQIAADEALAALNKQRR